MTTQRGFKGGQRLTADEFFELATAPPESAAEGALLEQLEQHRARLTLKDRGVLSGGEAAHYLNTGRERPPELVKRGFIEGYTTGSRWRISRASCDRYIDSCMKAGFDVAAESAA